MITTSNRVSWIAVASLRFGPPHYSHLTFGKFGVHKSLADQPRDAGSFVTQYQQRRGGRVVEGARLESVYAGNRIAGSNPAPSAMRKT
jgi:hypothetical protein